VGARWGAFTAKCGHVRGPICLANPARTREVSDGRRSVVFLGDMTARALLSVMGIGRFPLPRIGFKHAGIGALLLELCLTCALPAQGQIPTLEERLRSKDSAVSGPAVTSVLAGAHRAEPLTLVLAAARLFESGARDDAVFYSKPTFIRTMARRPRRSKRA